MSKKKSTGKKTSPLVQSGAPGSGDRGRSGRPEDPGRRAAVAVASTQPSGWLTSAGIRETIESVVVAFVLAFLFRTFEAEAFVIPTGSMAPTLMGRHKDVECPLCGSPFRVSASDEVDSQTNTSNGYGARILSGVCPTCRTPVDLARAPSYSGDRILVNKFAYQFHEPQRWDVAVFRYPGNAQTNYIKRIVGLPGERLCISGGDIFTRPLEGSAAWAIQRKAPQKLLAMLQVVYDNRYTPEILAEYPPETVAAGWPRQWRPEDGGSSGAFSTDDDLTFKTDGAAPGEVRLRYEHLVPTQRQWDTLRRQGRLSAADPVVPQLITDSCAYNTGASRNKAVPDVDGFGLHWVGDLALECTVDVHNDSGELIFELVEGGRLMQCRIDVSSGRATLSISGDDTAPFRLTGLCNVRGPGKHRIRFANCDDQLLLWVDAEVVRFAGCADGLASYEPLGNTRPDKADLSPAGVASRGVAVSVGELRLLRDIYYIADRLHDGHPRFTNLITDYKRLPFNNSDSPPSYVLSHPHLWRGDFDDLRVVEFTLQRDEGNPGRDQFFALGDNSAKSKDARLWERETFVRRDLLIGKAFFIYWPHSWHRIPGIGVPFPYFPNFAHMGLVR